MILCSDVAALHVLQFTPFALLCITCMYAVYLVIVFISSFQSNNISLFVYLRTTLSCQRFSTSRSVSESREKLS